MPKKRVIEPCIYLYTLQNPIAYTNTLTYISEHDWILTKTQNCGQLIWIGHYIIQNFRELSAAVEDPCLLLAPLGSL